MMDETVRKFLFENDVQDLALVSRADISEAREFVQLCANEGRQPPLWVVKVAVTNMGSVSR